MLSEPRVVAGGGGGMSIEDIMYGLAGDFLAQLPEKIESEIGENMLSLEVFRR